VGSFTLVGQSPRRAAATEEKKIALQPRARPRPPGGTRINQERTGIETKWFALTGRVVAVKVEADGDPHLALQDAIGDNPGLRLLSKYRQNRSGCEIRNTVFSWTRTRFPFHIQFREKTHDQWDFTTL